MRSTLTFLFFLLLMACAQSPEPVYPSPQQLAYQEMEMVGFIHFTMTDSAFGQVHIPSTALRTPHIRRAREILSGIS